MCVVKLNGPEWLPRAQETHWPCKASMYLHIAVMWGQTYALHGMEWPLPAFSGSLGGGVASCFFLVEKGTISSPWSL